jgi:hypothetical protein
VTDRIDQASTMQIPTVGTTIRSLERVPRVGTWEIVDHGTCAGNARRRALTRADTAPLCPMCDAEVRWQLTQVAPTVAADDPGVDPRP